MAIAIGDPVTKGIQRGRGGFMRSADDKPYITDPLGTPVKSGPRKGEIKRIPYGSPSNRGKQIENVTNLVKWGERRVVLGFGLDTELVEQCRHLATLDVDSDEYKTAVDGIIIRAKQAAEANLAADRGTHGHALTEDHDEERDWIARAEAGEIVGLDRNVQAALVEAWRSMLARNGLEILAVEASCVDDRWHLAGTLDRIARTTRPLRFVHPGGEIVDVPAGLVLVLDVKSGRRRVDDRTGAVLYWQAYAIQIASYAQSVPYDTDTETRGEWPWDIDQTHAVIAHLDVLGAIEGRPSCELVHVDLVASREHGGETVVQAKSWEARSDVFSATQLEVEGVAGELPPGPSSSTLIAGEGGRAANSTPSPASVEPAGPLLPPAPRLEPSPERLALVDARTQLATLPDQGAELTGPEYGEGWATLQRHYGDLSNVDHAWLAQLMSEATRRGVTFHAKHIRSLRVYELYRGLISLCAANGHEDELLRALIALVIGDVALYPGIETGHALGSMNAEQAKAFAQLVDQFNGPGLAGFVDTDGLFRLRVAA